MQLYNDTIMQSFRHTILQSGSHAAKQPYNHSAIHANIRPNSYIYIFATMQPSNHTTTTVYTLTSNATLAQYCSTTMQPFV